MHNLGVRVHRVLCVCVVGACWSGDVSTVRRPDGCMGDQTQGNAAIRCLAAGVNTPRVVVPSIHRVTSSSAALRNVGGSGWTDEGSNQ